MIRPQAEIGGARAWLLVPIFGIVGLVAVVAPDLAGGRIPGDLADARFNAYVLEHGYRWLTGADASFWNAPFYYPYPLTIAFSDNHLGSGPIYWLLRAAGLDREDAFRGWYLLGYIANFAASAYALRRISYRWVGVALGAFLFAFGLPVTAQSAHAQLGYRFGVPLAVLAMVQFDQRPGLDSLARLCIWTCWQFLCSIYIGYFLMILLTAFAVAFALARQRPAWSVLLHWPRGLREAWRAGSVRARAGLLLIGCASIALLIGLFQPYVRASHLYGFRQSWDDIAVMLPRPGSYLLADHSLLWHSPLLDGRLGPFRHEHMMFVGLSPILALGPAVALAWFRKARLDTLLLPTALAIALVCGLTLLVDGHSLYWFIAGVPGVSAIRAVTRIGLVMLFPVSMILAGAVSALSSARVDGRAANAWQVLIAILLVLECSAFSHYTSRKADWHERLRIAAADLPSSIPQSPILLLAPRLSEPWSYRELDAMLLAQDHGWATLNGYSGHGPWRWLSGACSDAISNIGQAISFLGQFEGIRFRQLLQRVVPVDYGDCDPSRLFDDPSKLVFADWPLPPELMAETAVRVEGLTVRDGAVVAKVSISNHGHMVVPAISKTGMWVRLSARYFPAVGLTSEVLRTASWSHRQNLDADVPPGGRIELEIPLRPPPVGGPYVVAVTMLQEGVAWFQDHGMPIAISAQKLTVDGGIRIGD
jgi:hypothetical protein